MNRYRKKPVEIEAIQLNWRNWNAVCDFVKGNISPERPAWEISGDEASATCGESGPIYIAMKVRTAHGDDAIVRHGDFIVPDSEPGTFYPVKPDVFARTYDEIAPVHGTRSGGKALSCPNCSQILTADSDGKFHHEETPHPVGIAEHLERH